MSSIRLQSAMINGPISAHIARTDLEQIQSLSLGAKNSLEIRDGGLGRMGMDRDGNVYKFSTSAFGRTFNPTTRTMREDCQRLREHMVKLAAALLPVNLRSLDEDSTMVLKEQSEVLRQIRKDLGLTGKSPAMKPLLDRRVVAAAIKTLNAAIYTHNFLAEDEDKDCLKSVNVDTEKIEGYYRHHPDLLRTSNLPQTSDLPQTSNLPQTSDLPQISDPPQEVDKGQAEQPKAEPAKEKTVAPKTMTYDEKCNAGHIPSHKVPFPCFDSGIGALRNLFDQRSDGSFKTPVDSTRGHLKLGPDGTQLVNVGKSFFSKADAQPNTREQNVTVRRGIYQALVQAKASQSLLGKARSMLCLPDEQKVELYPPEAGNPLERSVLKDLLDSLDRERASAFENIDINDGEIELEDLASDRIRSLEGQLKEIDAPSGRDIVLKRNRATNTYSFAIVKDEKGTEKANIITKREFLKTIANLGAKDETLVKIAKELGFAYYSTRECFYTDGSLKALYEPLNAEFAKKCIARIRAEQYPTNQSGGTENVAEGKKLQRPEELENQKARRKDFEDLAGQFRKIVFTDVTGKKIANPFIGIQDDDLEKMNSLVKVYEQAKAEGHLDDFKKEVMSVFATVVHTNPGQEMGSISEKLNSHFFIKLYNQ